jgi:hypothetical protein
VDAKLARLAKALAVLQTSFYSHLLADLQAFIAIGGLIGFRSVRGPRTCTQNF